MSKKELSPWKTTPVYGRFMGYYDGFSIKPSPDDMSTTMNNERYVHRPDLLSQDLYDVPDYWWVFGSLNNWKDPIFDMVMGKTFNIPNPKKIIGQ